MHVEWYGQSTFRLQAGGVTVVIDPFGDMSAAAAHGLQFDYPPLEGVIRRYDRPAAARG